MLVERIDDVIKILDDDTAELHPGKLCVQLKRIRGKINEALMINVSSERLISFLVEDFLDLSLVRAGKFRRVDKNFTLQQPIKEVLEVLNFKATYKSVKIDTHYLGLDPEKRVRCDERRVMQVLLNLLSNALKFTKTNGRIEIQVRLLRGKNSDFL